MKIRMMLMILIPMMALSCEDSSGSLEENPSEALQDEDTTRVGTDSDFETVTPPPTDASGDGEMESSEGADVETVEKTDVEWATPDSIDDTEETAPVEWSEDLCKSDEDRGYSVGEVLAPLDFYSCDGEVFSTENLCGAKATWVFIVHAWCGECRKLSKETEAIAKEYVPKGVAVVQLLVHSYEHQLPTSTDCQNWAEEFGLQDTLTLYDPVVKNILLQESQQTGLSIFLDGEQRIVSKEHFYDAESVRSTLDQIITK